MAKLQDHETAVLGALLELLAFDSLEWPTKLLRYPLGTKFFQTQSAVTCEARCNVHHYLSYMYIRVSLYL